MARIPEIIRRNAISQEAARPPEAGQGFRALAEISRIGAEFIKPAAADEARKAGEAAVYRDPKDGKLKVDERSVLGGEMAAIHNAAAYAKFLGNRHVDISETFSELSRNYEFDPGGFQRASDAYVQSIERDDNIPGRLKEELLAKVKKEASSRQMGLLNAEVSRTHKEADTSTRQARDMLTDDYINLMLAGNEEEAADKLKEIEAISQFRADAPYIGDVAESSEAYLRGVRGAAKAAVLAQKLDGLNGATEIPEELQSEINAFLKDPDLDPDTRQKLTTAATARIKGVQAAGMVKGMTDDSYEANIVRVESGGRDDAKAATSSALGPHQFTNGTWLGLVNEFKYDWANGLSKKEILALRTNRKISSQVFQDFRRGNQQGLRDAGIPITPGTEYAAHFLGIYRATKVLAADPSAALSDLLPDSVFEANSFLKGMSVQDFKNWANRKMKVKASDIAMMKPIINEIEDPQLRGFATREFTAVLSAKQDEEMAARLEYEERMQTDKTLTAQEIMEDHNLSNDDQLRLIRQLEAALKKTEDVASVQTNLSDESHWFDPGDKKERDDVDEYYNGQINNEAPLSKPEHIASAVRIAERTGYAPSSMASAIRQAVNSDDPELLSIAMETLGQMQGEGQNATAPYVGTKGMQDTLSDYQFYAQFNDPAAAAEAVIKQREDVPANVTKQAKAFAESLPSSDIINEFDDAWFSDPSLGSAEEEAAMLGEYRRLAEQAFIQTGNEDLAKNRAMDQMKRIYGTNMVTGSKRVMRYPPQKFYPAVAGSQDWMQDQIVKEVSIQAYYPENADVFGFEGEKRLKPNQIKLVSDPQTRSEVTSGQPPSYVVYYHDGETLQMLPQRFYFDPSEYQDAARKDAEKRREIDTGIRLQFQDMINNPIPPIAPTPRS